MNQQHLINLAISESTLKKLIQAGELSLNDVRCLDTSAKNTLKDLYLKIFAKSLGEKQEIEP
ncbi:MAG: hypothetical protein COA42_18515 [Alteromonadaceae bacterium]|nr:MAG: hypothetical protein COA42_18515 [Alteromonadaceae bacterium]